VEQHIQMLFIPVANTCMSSSKQAALALTKVLASVFQLLKKVRLQFIH